MQSDRKKTAALSTEVEASAFQEARMERPQLSGPQHGAELPPQATLNQAPQEMLHTSFSFETPRASIQEGGQRVSAERIRQIRSSLALRTRNAVSSRDRNQPETTKITVTHGETIFDRVMAWVALSLKSLEMRLFSRPQLLPKKNTTQPDKERERREREAKAREHLQKAMKVRRARKDR
ncbi:MAG: hypothetical protein RL417_1032 [Pseudomonadota bacterium]|jgi:hypothetical protein